jgi:hypothetical protein
MFRFYSNPEAVRVTVVGEHSDGEWRIAVARCSNKDNFHRKKGRMIAEGRLAKNKIYARVPSEDATSTNFVRMAKHFAEEVKLTKKIY